MPRKIRSFLLPAAVSVGVFLSVAVGHATDLLSQPKPAMAENCVNCPNCANCPSYPTAEPNTLHGTFDSVAFKANTIQIRIGDTVQLAKFDEDDIKVTTSEGKVLDGEALRKIDKGQELKITYQEKAGVKTAVRVELKPNIQVSKEMLISTEELEKLISQGAQKGKIFLFDARPLPRFQEGSIPTAVSLPYPSFDTMTDKLPSDKKSMIVFYCAGPTCTLSPASAEKAKKLGYSEVKVYRDGIPAWSEKKLHGALRPLPKGGLDRQGQPSRAARRAPCQRRREGFHQRSRLLPGSSGREADQGFAR